MANGYPNPCKATSGTYTCTQWSGHPGDHQQIVAGRGTRLTTFLWDGHGNERTIRHAPRCGGCFQPMPQTRAIVADDHAPGCPTGANGHPRY